MTHVKSVGFEKHFGKNKPISAIKDHIKYIEAEKEHHRNTRIYLLNKKMKFNDKLFEENTRTTKTGCCSS